MRTAAPPAPTLLARAREVARLRHLSLSTEDSYLLTIRSSTSAPAPAGSSSRAHPPTSSPPAQLLRDLPAGLSEG